MLFEKIRTADYTCSDASACQQCCHARRHPRTPEAVTPYARKRPGLCCRGDTCNTVKSRRVRRIWVTLFVGLAVLIGVTTGLLIFQPIGANWIEAAGTWFVGLVGVLALVVLAFWSEESERRRERERLQLEANNVFCDVRPVVPRGADDPRMVLVDQLEIEVANYSSRVITGMVCRVLLGGVFDWSYVLPEALRPGDVVGSRDRSLPSQRIGRPIRQQLPWYEHDRFMTHRSYTTCSTSTPSCWPEGQARYAGAPP
jgi:hypothetical protein